MICFYRFKFLKEAQVENNSFIESQNEHINHSFNNIKANILGMEYYVEEVEDIKKDTKVLVVKFEDYLLLKDKFNCKFIVVDKKYNFNNYFEFIKSDGAFYLLESSDLYNQIYSILNYIFPTVKNKIEIDNQLNKIKIDNKVITLTTKEMLVFEYLNDNHNKLCLRKDILVNVLKYHPSSDSRIVDVYIRYLRMKLEQEGEKIKTIRGKGYIYEQD